MEPKIARTLETLGDLKSAGYQLYGHCYCGHGQILNLDLLIDRFGKDYVFVGETRMVTALSCTACGRPAEKITLQPR